MAPPVPLHPDAYWLLGDYGLEDGSDAFAAVAAWRERAGKRLRRVRYAQDQALDEIGPSDLALFAFADSIRSPERFLSHPAKTAIFVTPGNEPHVNAYAAVQYCRRYSNVFDVCGPSLAHQAAFPKRLNEYLKDPRTHYKPIRLKLPSITGKWKLYPSTPFDTEIDFRDGIKAWLQHRRDFEIHDPGSWHSERDGAEKILTTARESHVMFVNTRKNLKSRAKGNENVYYELGAAKAQTDLCNHLLSCHPMLAANHPALARQLLETRTSTIVFRHVDDAGELPFDIRGHDYIRYIDPLHLAMILQFGVEIQIG